jgi:hypothetical protein
MRSKLPLLALLALVLTAAGCSSCGSPCGSRVISCEYNTRTCRMPYVLGMMHNDAAGAIHEAGFASHNCDPSHDPNLKVRAQKPPADSLWPCDRAVELLLVPVEYDIRIPATNVPPTPR